MRALRLIDRSREELMRKLLTLFCVGLAACDGGLQADRRLQRGMTEQEVTQLEGKQVPDRIIMRTCGTETPNRFPARFMFTVRACGWAGSAQRSPSSSRMSEDNGW